MIAKKSVLFASLLASCATLSAAPTTYYWSVGMDHASITLDSNASASGSLSDIESITLFLPDTGSTTFTPGSPNMTLTGPFSWTSSAITALNLSFTTPTTTFGDNLDTDNVTVTQDSLDIVGNISFTDKSGEITSTFINDSGSFTTTRPLMAPESFSSAILLLIGALPLCLLGSKFRASASPR